LMTRLSNAGAETFCLDCRRITKSASLNFEFKIAGSDEGVVACTGGAGDSRPGFKGPGEKARCWTYDEGNESQKQAAMRKAKASAYATQHKNAAARIVNAATNPTSPIGGAAAIAGAGPSANPAAGQAQSFIPNNTNTQAATPLATPQLTNPAAAPIAPTQKNAVAYFTGADQFTGNGPSENGAVGSNSGVPTTSQDYSNEGQSPIGEVTAPNGMQPGELNGANPLNSGTTASKRLAELINDDIKSHMGPGFCTEHMAIDGCNPDQNSH
jgi:hypothetical protein